MKKLLYIFLAVVVIILQSCTQEIMDEINFNPDNPTDVSSRLTLSDNMIELGVTGCSTPQFMLNTPSGIMLSI